MTSKPGSFLGRWRIVESEMWDSDALDLVVPAHITFGPDQMGELEMIAIGAAVDYRVGKRDGAPVVEFSWEGISEGDHICGRGWARFDATNDRIRGILFIHQSDESEFVAVRD
jgi:hypothetical protein